MVLSKREYTANVINREGVLKGSVWVQGHIDAKRAYKELEAQNPDPEELFLVSFRRIT